MNDNDRDGTEEEIIPYILNQRHLNPNAHKLHTVGCMRTALCFDSRYGLYSVFLIFRRPRGEVHRVKPVKIQESRGYCGFFYSLLACQIL